MSGLGFGFGFGLRHDLSAGGVPWPSGEAPPDGFRWDYLIDVAGQRVVNFAGQQVVALVAI